MINIRLDTIYILLSINYNGTIDILYTSIDQLKHKLDINYTQTYIHYDLYEWIYYKKNFKTINQTSISIIVYVSTM